MSAGPSSSSRPAFSIKETGRGSHGDLTGELTVERPEDLEAAMSAWRWDWYGYEPSISADPANPCRATWSRWRSCA